MSDGMRSAPYTEAEVMQIAEDAYANGRREALLQAEERLGRMACRDRQYVFAMLAELRDGPRPTHQLRDPGWPQR